MGCTTIRHSHLHIILAFFLFLTGAGAPLHAQWSSEDGGLFLARFVNNRHHILPDGEDGAWVAFGMHSGYTAHTYLQRIDGDGYRLFGDSLGLVIGPADTNNINRNKYLGLLAAEDDAVWVTYINDTVDPDAGFSVYAQKVNLDGTFVFDSTGVLVVDEPMSQQLPSTYNPLICSDGAGGFWQLYREDDHVNGRLAVAGLNANGTQKVEEGVQLSEQYFGDLLQSGICKDGLGGAWIVWESYELSYTMCQHINAEGERQFDEPFEAILLQPGRNYARYSCIPDGAGGFYLCFGGSSVVFQHISPDGSLLWGIYGMETTIVYGTVSPSEFLPMLNGSLVVTTVRAPYSANLIRMHRNGEAYYDSLEIPVEDTYNDQVRYTTATTSVSCTDGDGGIYGFYGWARYVGDGDYSGGMRVHRINDTGNLIWGTDTVEVSMGQGGRFFPKCVPCPESNAVILSIGKGWGYELWLYKILSDGRVAGRDTGIHEQEDRSSHPYDFRILNAWPNPFNATTNIEVALPATETYRFRIYDLSGRVIFARKETLTPGTHTWSWTPASATASGYYFAQVLGQKETTATKSIVYIK